MRYLRGAPRLLDEDDSLAHLDALPHGRVRARPALHHDQHAGHAVALREGMLDGAADGDLAAELVLAIL